MSSEPMSEERLQEIENHFVGQPGVYFVRQLINEIRRLHSATAVEEQFQYAGWREQIESRNSEIATLHTQLEGRNAQVAALIEGMDVIVQKYKPIAIQWLADHDAQVRADFARIVLKRWHNDVPRIELTYDWLSERARADRLSNKLDNSKGE